MRIIVYQGDENRAKIETEWTDDMFFRLYMKRLRL